MLTRSRSLLLTLLSAFLIAACGDSDPSGLGDGSGSGDVDLTGTWNLTDSDDITLPLVRNDYNACQTEAEAAGYESGFGQVSIPEYWMVFKPNRTVAQGAASRRRCVFVDEHGSLAYSDWSAETREEKDVGVCRRSGTDIQLFRIGIDPDTGPPDFTGKLVGGRLHLTPVATALLFPPVRRARVRARVA